MNERRQSRTRKRVARYLTTYDVHSPSESSRDLVRSGNWTARARLFAIVITLIHVLLAWNFRTPVIATEQDDAEYVLLSREILRGDYRDSFDVNAPVHAKFPPGYPAFLAGLSKLVGEREQAFLFASVLLSAGALLLFLDWGRKTLPSLTWYAIAGVVGLNPELIILAGRILSEPLFLFLVYLALWNETNDESRRGTSWATIVGSVATVVRSAGLAISVGLIASRLIQRRWIAALSLAVLTLVTGALWTWHSAQAPEQEERHLYVAGFQKALSVDERSPIRVIADLLRNKAEALTIDELPTMLAIPVFPGNRIDNAIGALIIVTLIPIGMVLLWKRSKAAATVLLAYGALYIAWPYDAVRLIAPVFPLIVLALFLAAEFLGAKFRRPWGVSIAVGSLAAYLAAGLVLRFVRERDTLAACDKDYAPYSQPACFRNEGDWTFIQAAAFARDNFPAESMVLTVKEPSFYYHSGRRTTNVNFFLKEDSTTLARALRDRGIEWVVVSNAGPLRRRMGVLVASACKDFDLVKQFDSRTMVLRVRAPGQSVSAPACDALATWRAEAGTPGSERGITKWPATEVRSHGP